MTKAFRGLQALVLLVSCLHVSVLFGATRGAAANSTDAVPFGLPVFSDFDGDNKPDRATLSSEGSFKTIYINWGRSSRSSFSFDSGASDPGRLLTGDIDRNGAIDLIWVSLNDSRKFAVWLGNGHGQFIIGTNSEFNFRRVQALLGEGKPRLTEKSSRCELPGAMLSTSMVTPPVFAWHPALALPENSVLTPPLPPVCWLCFSAIQKRGPPSKSS